ncbi:methyltransferase [Pseudomonas sp. CGJS7]|uniref:methyltransferase n=1 Tax=Pseudomonas sp. CGJS7 TaxID=3109348 RepID=UPI00300BE2F4
MNLPVDTASLCVHPFEALRRLDQRTALIDGERRWSAAQLLAAQARAAHWLRARGVGAGTRLVWDAEDGSQVALARLAALGLGAVWSQRAYDEAAAVRIGIEDAAALARYSADDTAEHFETFEPDAAAAPTPAPFAGVPEHLAVALPLNGRGGEIALAAWSAGACVHVATHATAAKLLAWIERSGADHAALPRASLRAVLTHPALGLNDLSGLRAWLCECPDPVERERVRTLTGCELIDLGAAAGVDLARTAAELRAHPQVGEAVAVVADDGARVAFVVPARRERSEPAPADLQTSAAAAVEATLAGVDIAGAVAATEALSRTALHSMLGALQACGLFADRHRVYDAQTVLDAARVAAPHRRLIRRWLKVLSEQGLLRHEPDGYRLADAAPDCAEAAMAAAWDEVERNWRASADGVGTIDYARRNAERLPELIAGELNAVHLLFPEGRSDLARSLYRESIAARYQHRSVAALVAGLAAEPRVRPLRLLEVGAGTGATSETLLPALQGLAAEHPVDYLFTDVSRYFIEQAATRFGDYPNLSFGLYDIDRPGREQGYAPNSFDLIVAGGVLNAARNTDDSLRWLGELLRPGGWLLLSEPTVEEFWVMASQALMLADADDERADSQATFLSWPQWQQALDQAGFERVADLPPPAHPLERLGHRIFAARIKSDRHAPESARLRESLGDAAPDRIELLDALPLTAAGAADTDLLRRWASQTPAGVFSCNDLRGPR